MGNASAKGTRKFLEDPVWSQYYVAEWRSERSRELDRYGGPGRPPVARGDSVTAKLNFIEAGLRGEQKRHLTVLNMADEERGRREAGIAERERAAQELRERVVLNTDTRAERRASETSSMWPGAGVGAGGKGHGHPPPQLPSPGAGSQGSVSASGGADDDSAVSPSSQQQSHGSYTAQYNARQREQEAQGGGGGGGGNGGGGGGPLGSKDFSLLSGIDPEVRKKMTEQRKKMLEYAKNIAKNGAPKLNLPAIRSKVASQWARSDADHGYDGDGDDEGEGEPMHVPLGPLTPPGAAPGQWSPASQPADWRLRVHQARRRALLAVMAASRWQMALTQRPGPKRLPRVNSFSYYIPQVLGDEANAFIKEARVVARILADAAAREVPPDSDALGEGSPAGSLLDPPLGPAGPGPGRRTPPRRGMSESGVGGNAAAGGGGAAAAGGGGPGPLPALNGGMAGGLMLPKNRREILKTSSGRSFQSNASSAADAALLAGHYSDAEASYNGRRSRGGGVGLGVSGLGGAGSLPPLGTPGGGLVLPAIGARASMPEIGSTGSNGPDGPGSGSGSGSQQHNHRTSVSGVQPLPPEGGPPAAPRMPRGKVDKLAAAGSNPESGRTSRRQSDSALPLPPGIQAAAAAGAAVLTGGGGGGTAAVNRRTGGVRMAGLKPRVSDNGGPSRLRRDGSEGGALTNGGGGGGHRRSDAGTAAGLTSMASAPADALSGTVLPGNGGGGGGGSGNGGGGGGLLPALPGLPAAPNTPTKPLTLAQARRLALLSEAGAPAAGDEVSRQGMSPSRLVPLKLNGGASTTPNSASSDRSAGLRNAGRSPDRGVLSGPGLGSPASSSILDSLQGRAGGGGSGVAGAGAGGLLLSGGAFREALAIAAVQAGVATGGSPLNSPGHRGSRVLPLDPGLGAGPEPSGPSASGPSASGPSASARSDAGLASAGGSASDAAADGVAASTTDIPAADSPAAATSPQGSGAGAGPAPPSQTSTPLQPQPPSLPPPNQPSQTSAQPHAPAPPPGPPPMHQRGLIAAKPHVAQGAGAGGGGSRGSSHNSRSKHPPPPAGLDAVSSAKLSKSQQLMSMYANRVNAAWSESQQWAPPVVLPAGEYEMFASSDAWVPYKVSVLQMLKQGKIVVHIDACQDSVVVADGGVMDVWTSDPWALVQRLRPGSLPLTERIEGVPLGARCLQQLVLAVEGLAGKDAVPKLVVVLAINDDQRNAVVADIIRARSYGLKPENLILTAQRKRCGYRYDPDHATFLEDPSTPAMVLGSGYSLCQLAWLGDAFSVSAEGELQMLMGRTLLERFADAGAEWLVARRARDLSLLTEGGVVDLGQLAYSLYVADRHGGNMVLQAAHTSAITIPRAYDSTLLALRSRPPSALRKAAAARGTTVAAAAAKLPPPPQASTISSGGGVGGKELAAGVVTMRGAELSSPVMVEALAAVRKAAGSEGWVGLQRYMLHLPTLHGMLNTLGVFRPKLAMSGDVARLSLDAGDITADPRAAAVAVQARTSPAIITSPNEVDDLIPLLMAQDRSASFRDIVSGHGGGGEGGAQVVVAPLALLSSKQGQRILLFIANNDVTQLAVNLVLMMARPGRDVVHLVTVVHNSLQSAAGQALVVKYLNQISNAMIEAHADVEVKGLGGLLDCMEAAVRKLEPHMVVMASAALTMSNLNTASVMGSVTLSCLKRLTLPIAVVTSNSKHLVLTQRRTALRCMAVVESTARPCLNFLCGACMEPLRGDKLVLAAYHPTRQMTTQQQQTQRRLVDNFSDIASSHRFHSSYRMQLDGPLEKALSSAIDGETVHLVGLQVAAGTKGIPGHVLGLIRSCKGGVLVFRDTA
ncbi:hypothetical protein HYH03_007261 [Edaphochlamys debaryana]|uniref:Uncharacterized protein n=1 Tax=Edaphochlamys debaryana TaxID=47281 RepID=A0A835Y0P9_9CHLO|nr:hypothetical protein HYH03_007261 [Edaphochlamys debaryana]|eukprot:KAG2494492.1 hypothetical protein HYH03_007261 [Edaphochlamys debaryana]